MRVSWCASVKVFLCIVGEPVNQQSAKGGFFNLSHPPQSPKHFAVMKAGPRMSSPLFYNTGVKSGISDFWRNSEAVEKVTLTSGDPGKMAEPATAGTNLPMLPNSVQLLSQQFQDQMQHLVAQRNKLSLKFNELKLKQ